MDFGKTQYSFTHHKCSIFFLTKSETKPQTSWAQLADHSFKVGYSLSGKVVILAKTHWHQRIYGGQNTNNKYIFWNQFSSVFSFVEHRASATNKF